MNNPMNVRWVGAAVLALCVVLPVGVGDAVALGEASEGNSVVQGPPPAPLAPSPAAPVFLGAIVHANSSSWRQVLARSETTGGLVLAVVPFSPAHAAGLAIGDVVVAVDDRAVHDEEQLLRELRREAKVERELTVVRPDGSVWTPRVKLANAQGQETSARLLAQLGKDPNPANRFLFATSVQDAVTARAILRQLTAELPEFAPAHAALAARLAEPDGTPEATSDVRAQLSRAIELDPASVDVQAMAASLFLDMNDLTAAEQRAARAVELDPDSPLAHHLLGRTRLAAARPADALPDLRRAVDLNPYDPGYYRFLAEGYLALGDGDNAARTTAAFREVQAFTPLRPSPQHSREAAPFALVVAAAALVGGLVQLIHSRVRAPQALGSADTKRELRDVALLEALAACGAFSAAVPLLARALALSPAASSHELANHVVPGVVTVVASAVGLRRVLAGEPDMPSFLVGLSPVLVLPGLAMTIWHVPVALNAAGGIVRWDAALFHSVAGPMMLTLAIWVSVRAWKAADRDQRRVALIRAQSERATP